MSGLAPAILWRTKLRSTLRDNWQDQVSHCVQGHRVGIGWGLPALPSGADLETVCEGVLNHPYPGWGKRAVGTIRRFAEQAEAGDYVWTRDTHGLYWLGRLAGPYYYDASDQAFEVDIHQTRPCDWIPAGLNDLEVPGGVIRCFIGTGASFSRVHDAGACKLTPLLWAKATGRPLPDVSVTAAEVLAHHLDPYDVEDLVYVWMQAVLNYVAFPRSRMTDTPAYEWTMQHRVTGKPAIVQIKTGNTPVNLEQLAAAAQPGTDTYAVSTRGLVDGPRSAVTRVVDPDELLEFATARPELLPPRVRTWFALATPDS